MSHRLQHRLAESVVVIGADENSGLRPYPGSTKDGDPAQQAYLPSLLASLNESTAIYPFEYPQTSHSYPSSVFQNTANYSKTVSFDDGGILCGGKLRGTLRSAIDDDRLRYGLRRQKSICIRPNQLKNPIEPAISNETIDGIPMLCSPQGIQLFDSPNAEFLLNLILTDIKGTRLYATGMCFCRQFQYHIKTNSLSQLQEVDMDRKSENSTSRRVFVPCYVFVISKYRYFSVFREVLSALHDAINKSTNNFRFLVEKFSVSLAYTPVLSLGCSIILEFKLFNNSFKIFPILPLIETVIDHDLTLLFKALTIDDIVFLVSALLQQKRLVLVSSSPAITTLCCETLIILLAPFRWKFTYVPYLPENLLEMLDAPGPVLYGCESSHIEGCECLDEIIVANLDTGKVIVPLTVEVFCPPKISVSHLKVSLSSMKTSYDHYFLSSLEPQNAVLYREKRAEFNFQNQKVILYSFLAFMVDLFRDVTVHLRHRESANQSATNFFNTDSFLKMQTEAKSFYSSVIKTELFDSFLRERFSSQFDAWSYLEERIRSSHSSVYGRTRASLLSVSSKSSDLSDSNSELSFTSLDEMFKDSETSNSNSNPGKLFNDFSLKYCQILQLPSAVSNDAFHRLISKITSMLQDSEITITEKANCLILRSDLHNSLGKKIEALEDLYELCKTDIKLVSKRQVRSIMESLSDSEWEQCICISFFDTLRKMVEFNKTRQRMSIDESETGIMKQFHLPNRPISLDEFIEVVEDAEISSDVDVAETLFRILSLDDKNSATFKQVSPSTFADFYQYWNKENSDLDLTINVTEFKVNEIILKVSPVIRVDPIGSGRLVLTQERLLIVCLGENVAKHLLTLKNITSVHKQDSASRMFSKSYSILKIEHKTPNLDSLLVWLKNETSVWEVIILEMTAGQAEAEERKDSSLLNKAVDQCMILDAVFDCVKNDVNYFSSKLKEIVSQVASFSSNKRIRHRLSETTRQLLCVKISSNLRITKDFSVEALVCVGGNQLWASISSVHRQNHLVIIDIETMTVNTEILSMTKYKFMCMVTVADGTIWAGAHNNNIYVICNQKRTLVQELIAHQDLVLAITSSESGDMVASGCPHGEVILWRTEDRSRITSWKLDSDVGVLQLNIYKSHVYCCSKKAVYVYNLGGDRVAVIAQDLEKPTHTSLHQNSFECQCILNDCLYVGMSRRCCLLVYSLDSPVAPYRITHIDCAGKPCSAQKPRTQTCNDCKAIMKGSLCTKCREVGRCRGLSRIVPFDQQIWSCCKDGNIFIYDLRTGTLRNKLEGHEHAIQSVCSSPERGLVFTGGRSDGGKIAVWNGRLSATAIEPHSGSILLKEVEQSAGGLPESFV